MIILYSSFFFLIFRFSPLMPLLPCLRHFGFISPPL